MHVCARYRRICRYKYNHACTQLHRNLGKAPDEAQTQNFELDLTCLDCEHFYQSSLNGEKKPFAIQNIGDHNPAKASKSIGEQIPRVSVGALNREWEKTNQQFRFKSNLVKSGRVVTIPSKNFMCTIKEDAVHSHGPERVASPPHFNVNHNVVSREKNVAQPTLQQNERK